MVSYVKDLYRCLLYHKCKYSRKGGQLMCNSNLSYYDGTWLDKYFICVGDKMDEHTYTTYTSPYYKGKLGISGYPSLGGVLIARRAQSIIISSLSSMALGWLASLS